MMGVSDQFFERICEHQQCVLDEIHSINKSLEKLTKAVHEMAALGFKERRQDPFKKPLPRG